MNYECFDVSVEEHVAHIQLSRPEKRNSMVSSFWKDLPEIVSSLDASGEIRAIVISSTGPHFTSGIDLSLLSNSAGNEESQSTQHRAGRFYHPRFHQSGRHIPSLRGLRRLGQNRRS